MSLTDLENEFPNLSLVRSRALDHLFTKIRDEKSSPRVFKQYSDRIMRILSEEGLALFATKPTKFETPTGRVCSGVEMEPNLCAVSIIRAGDSLLDAVISCDPSVSVGKILIQRDESTADKKPIMFYSKLPKNIQQKKVLLVDPMLATGGSAKMALKTLIDAGVSEDNILFLNVISCPEGIKSIFSQYPKIRVLTACVDESLNDDKYIVPGLGDYGDRYFNTV